MFTPFSSLRSAVCIEVRVCVEVRLKITLSEWISLNVSFCVKIPYSRDSHAQGAPVNSRASKRLKHKKQKCVGCVVEFTGLGAVWRSRGFHRDAAHKITSFWTAVMDIHRRQSRVIRITVGYDVVGVFTMDERIWISANQRSKRPSHGGQLPDTCRYIEDGSIIR